MIEENQLSIYRTNILYLVLAMSLIFIGSLVQGIDLFTGILITQILLLILPNIFFIKKNGLSIKKTWRLNRLSLKNIILVFIITLLTYPVAVYFQAIFVSLLSSFKDVNPNTLPIEVSQAPFLWSVFFIAIVPGICEEIMFRGTILRAYEKLGIKKAIIISAVLFGVFHFTLLNLIGPVILGIVFGIMVYRTNSIYSSMLGHALNNLIALTLNYFLMKNLELINEVGTQEVEIDIISSIISFLIISLFIIFLINIIKKLLNKLTSESEEISEEIEDNGENIYVEKKRVSYYSFLPLLLVAIMFIIFNFMFIFR